MNISDKIILRFIDSPDPWVQKVNHRGWRCYWCGKILTLKTLTKDHLQPTSRGGSDHVENLEPCCLPCNSMKHCRTEAEFIEYRGAPPALSGKESTGISLFPEISETNSAVPDLDVSPVYRPKAISRLRKESEAMSWAWKNPA